jgi:hypothetical protein
MQIARFFDANVFLDNEGRMQNLACGIENQYAGRRQVVRM